MESRGESMKRRLFVAMVLGAVMAWGAAAPAAVILPLDDTGWQVTVYQVFEGNVGVALDNATSEDGIRIQLVKEFQSSFFSDGLYGQPLYLKFKLVNADAPNFNSTIIIMDELISNLTGQHWTDFHMQLVPEINNTETVNVGFDPGYKFSADKAFRSVEFDPTMYQGMMLPNESRMPLKLDFQLGDGGAGVANGADWFAGGDTSELRIRTDLEEGQVFWLKEFPTIPEPMTMTLLALGGLAVIGRRKKA
jgi:hypothetical protein